MGRARGTVTKKRQRPQPSEASAAVAATSSEAAPARLTLKRLGRYELLFELARGGMGTVYAARLSGPHDFNRIVAIKRLRTDSNDDEDRTALLDEAKLGARIRHPNVVQIYELAQHQGEPFVAMELIEGVSLARLLDALSAAEERLSPALAAWIIERCALGLHAAHELRDGDGQTVALVHRDISPDNILLSYDGRVCVSDFGIARFRGERQSTARGIIKGKFAYMSPEQTRARALDRRSDLFALGAVFHEMLSGEILFHSPSAADTIRRVNEQPIDDLSADEAEVPASLAAIAQHCLQRQVSARPEDARQVASALRIARRALVEDVDDTDLAALLARLFPDDRAELHARLRLGHSADVGEAVSSPNTVAASIVAQRPPSRTRGWLVALVVGVLLLIGSQIWTRTNVTTNAAPPSEGEKATPPAPSAALNPAPSTALSPVITANADHAPHDASSVQPSATSLPAPPPRAASVSRVTPHKITPAPRPRIPTNKPPAGTSSARPPATPTSTSSALPQGGIPFGTL